MLELSYYNNYGKSDQDNFKQRITFDVKADLTTMKYKHKDSNGTAVFWTSSGHSVFVENLNKDDRFKISSLAWLFVTRFGTYLCIF